MRISDWSSDVCSSDLVAGHEGERGFKEVEPAECGELVEHQQQLVLALHAVAAIERFSEAPSDLVEDQTNERLGAADVRRRYHEVQRYRMLRGNQVRDAPVAARREYGHRGVAVQAKETHRGRQHAGTLVVRRVEHSPPNHT